MLETSRLVLELLHAGYAAEGSRRAGSWQEGHGAEGATRVSRQAVRASIELYQRGDVTMGELASRVGMSNGWASRVVEELVAAGMAERAVDPVDRRVVHVRLAPRAREMAESAYRWRVDVIERALAGMGSAERDAVRTFLARVIEELSGHAGTGPAR